MPRLPILVALLVLIAAGAAWLALRPSEPLVLGLVGSLSGRFAALGTTGRDGAILAVEELNRAGGVLGRELRLDIQDDTGEGAACAAAYERLAAAGRRVVIGPFATGPATGALPAIDRLGLLTIAPTVAGDNFTGKDDGFIRLYPSTRAMGRQLGAMIAADGVRRLAVIGDAANGPFAATTITGLRERLAAVELAPEIAYDSRAKPSFRELAAAVAGCDGVLLIASSLDAAALCQRIREHDAACRLYCSSWAVSNELLANGGQAIEGMSTVLPVSTAGDDPAWAAFAGRYRERFAAEPTHVAMLHYEAVRLAAAAVVTAGGDDPAAVKRAIVGAPPFPGVQAPITVDAYGDADRPYFPLVVRDRRLVGREGRP